MKIAIIGAPGSGKTELANALKLRLFDKSTGQVSVVDDYVNQIGKDTDLAMGRCATYVGNLAVIMGRIARERKAVVDGASDTITCGTMIESSVYATMEAVRKQTESHFTRITQFMGLLGLLRQDTWDYDHVFLLKLDEPDPETTAGQVDQSLFMAVNSFGVHYVPLDGTVEEQVDKAITSIEERQQELDLAGESFITPPPSPPAIG